MLLNCKRISFSQISKTNGGKMKLKINETHYEHWDETDKADLLKAESFTDLAVIALRVIPRFGGKVVFVSGPITTGGCGNIQENLEVIARTIEKLKEKQQVFSIMPFEQKMGPMVKDWNKNNPGKYCNPLLNKFYDRIFEPEIVCITYFIHGYESSHGSMWEYERCVSKGIRFSFLCKGFHEQS